MKDSLDFATFASERKSRLVYPDPITGDDDAWHMDLLLGGLATFIFQNQVYEGTVDEMERKLFELTSDEELVEYIDHGDEAIPRPRECLYEDFD